MKLLETPISRNDVEQLEVGDVIHLSGTMVTMRDQACRKYVELAKKGAYIPLALEGAAIYHCGPLVVRREKGWIVLSAGPTTSMRVEPFMPEVLQRSKARLVIGKGGVGAETAKALVGIGGAYCEFTGGAGVLAAQAIRRVADVKWLDLGLPEAVWFLEVERFGPLVVTVDSKGENLRAEGRLPRFRR